MQYIYNVKEIIWNKQFKLFELPRMYSTKTLIVDVRLGSK